MLSGKNFKLVSAKLVCNVRYENRLTQKNFASKLGVSPSCINKRETEGILGIVELYNFCYRLNLDFYETTRKLIDQSIKLSHPSEPLDEIKMK